MNYFEQELRRLFGNNAAISDKKFVGRAFFGKLTDKLRVRIDFPDSYDRSGLISSLAREKGIKATIYSGVVWNSDSVDRQAMEGAYCTEHYAVENPIPETEEFVRKYYDRYNSKPDETAIIKGKKRSF